MLEFYELTDEQIEQIYIDLEDVTTDDENDFSILSDWMYWKRGTREMGIVLDLLSIYSKDFWSLQDSRLEK